VTKNRSIQCAKCNVKQCLNGKDCFEKANNHKKLYEDTDIKKLYETAAAIEAKHYNKETRLGEIILFAKELRCKKVGLAFCIGLAEEAKIIDHILSRHFEVVSVCCKACGINKKQMGLPQIKPGKNEITCNPAGQANLLNHAKTNFNILCGLCLGHDMIFTIVSKAPVTTLIVKDRILAHNPAGALYSKYIRNKMLADDK
jgi:uncharacterized metal-binding protein